MTVVIICIGAEYSLRDQYNSKCSFVYASGLFSIVTIAKVNVFSIHNSRR